MCVLGVKIGRAKVTGLAFKHCGQLFGVFLEVLLAINILEIDGNP